MRAGLFAPLNFPITFTSQGFEMNKVISVLIVEDEATSVLYIEYILLSFGYEICGKVATGEGAVAMAANKNPDIILMDISLAGKIDGIEAACRIRQNKNIPIIFTTGHTDEEIFERAQKLVPAAYLVKPIDIDELRVEINSALGLNNIKQ